MNMTSSSSLSDSDSSSSSSSDDDSLYGGSGCLGASQYNRQKALRPIHSRTAEERSGDSNNSGAANLTTRRLYHPIPIISSHEETPQNTSINGGENKEGEEKSELEKAVLMDCLSSHFLLSHLPQSELEQLCANFEKVRYRDHEIIYSQGEEARFIYILYLGEVARVQGASTNAANSTEDKSCISDKYTILGELAVLTGSSYKETIQSISKNCILFRLSSLLLHRALRPTPEIDASQRSSLLKCAIPDEMIHYFTNDDLKDLSSAMTAQSFEAGDVLVRKEERLDALVIIAKGSVIAKDVNLGGRSYEDQLFGPDTPTLSFGWQSLMSSSQMATPNFKGKMVAQSDGVALTLSKSSFTKVMKGHHSDSSTILEQMAARRLAKIELQQMPVFQDSLLDESQINGLLDLMHRCEYIPQDDGSEQMTVFKSGDKIEAAIYFVREGAVTLETNKGQDRRTVASGNYFGEANMLRDQNKDGRKHFVIRSPHTATVHGPKTVVDVLYLEECRSVVNTTTLGLGKMPALDEDTSTIQWGDIKRHSLLGTGTFGQVWLASIPKPELSGTTKIDGAGEPTCKESERQIVALKIQSKYQVIESGEVGRVMAERNILATLNSPFLLHLFHAFQDESLLYMITSIAQGGELESLIPDDGMCESSAKFYAAGILEGLAWMHRRHLLHRDIKPTNVLINEKGYPVLIDFGFAKYVPDKSYTFVGSPIFTAPEIIRFQGHDRKADYWAWAVLVYRLVTGKYPFYEDGIDELQLYKRICSGRIELDGNMTVDFRTLIVAILYPNPEQRLGSGRNGWRDIFNSPWFGNDDNFDIRRLRMQKMPAPWVPTLNGELDASSFHPRDESEIEDLLRQTFPMVADKHQQIFASFGHQIE